MPVDPNEHDRFVIRQGFDPSATYEVRGPSGTVEVQERSVLVALFRRLVGFIPYIGGYADWLPIPYHFTFTDEGREIGVHRCRIGAFRDVYDLDLSADADRVLDRRLALATAVGLDALQAR